MSPEQDRSEIEARVRAAIKRNQEVRAAIPESASDENYWKEVHQKGQACTLHVRRIPPEEHVIDKQWGMYPFDEEGPDGDTDIVVGYTQGNTIAGSILKVPLSRIVAVE